MSSMSTRHAPETAVTSSGLKLDLVSLNTLDQVEALVQSLMAEVRKTREENEELRRYGGSRRLAADHGADTAVKDETIHGLRQALQQKENDCQKLMEELELQKRRVTSDAVGQAERDAGLKARIQEALDKLDELEKMILAE